MNSLVGVRAPHFLFPQGYILTRTDVATADSPVLDELLRRWTFRRIGDLRLRHDPVVPCTSLSVGDATLALLGHAIDPFEELSDVEEMLAGLGRARQRSDVELFDAVDRLTGRFVLVIGSGSGTMIFGDAIGSRTVVYTRAGSAAAVASHSALLAEYTGAGRDRQVDGLIRSSDYRRDIGYLPGLATPFEGQAVLTPNTYLDLEERRPVRFFPRGPRPRRLDRNDIVDELVPVLRRQVDLLSEVEPLALSVTAGIDSRVTLAAARDHRSEIFCYTYVAKESSRRDSAVAAAMCRSVGVAHATLSVPGDPGEQPVGAYFDAWRRTTAGIRSHAQARISKALFQAYPSRRLHIKSVSAEIGKPYYRSRLPFRLSEEISPPELARCYGIERGSPFVIGAFREYVDLVEFNQGSLCGYDLYDLFYWEHRIGTWQGLQNADFDAAQRTVDFTANRRILASMITPPLEQREDLQLHRALIMKMWPELLDHPVNPLPPAEAAKEKIKHVLRNVGMLDFVLRQYRRVRER